MALLQWNICEAAREDSQAPERGRSLCYASLSSTEKRAGCGAASAAEGNRRPTNAVRLEKQLKSDSRANISLTREPVTAAREAIIPVELPDEHRIEPTLASIGHQPVERGSRVLDPEMPASTYSSMIFHLRRSAYSRSSSNCISGLW